MQKPTYNQLKSLCKLRGYPFFTKPFDLNFFGIRALPFHPDRFDDLLAIAYTDIAGNPRVFAAPASTDPGLIYIKQPISPAGCAFLKPGRYPAAYKLGLHKGSPALVQSAPMTVYRISALADLDSLETAPTQSGIFGINVHQASKDSIATVVGSHSAGCQVVQWISDLTYIRDLLRAQSRYTGCDSLSYILINQPDIVDTASCRGNVDTASCRVKQQEEK